MESARSRELVDSLRSLGLDKHIELPQIVAMGDTSSGKSSLLSALSGITFPSDKDLTTRCPTQLVLTTHPVFSGTVRLQRYDNPSDGGLPEALNSMEEITEAIERITQQLVDEGQSISDDSIVINVKGPKLPNLTLTDLPGIVRSVKDGEDQAMIGRVRALIHRYMIQERTVILAVHPANVDIHNSEILNAASEADREGARTICVITKPDLVDPGSEGSVIELMSNKVKFLKLGYHMVKCRGQNSLDSGISVADGLVDERNFFMQNPIWSTLDRSLTGNDSLSEKLGGVLQETISRSLPSVVAEIDQKLKTTIDDISKLGYAMDSISAKRAKYNTVSEQFLSLLGRAFEGRYDSSYFASKSKDDPRLRAKLRKFDEQFATELRRVGKQAEKWKNEKYRTLYRGDMIEFFDSSKKKWICMTITKSNWKSGTERWDGVDEIPSKDSWRFKATLDLEDLKSTIAENRGSELTIFPSHDIFIAILTPEIATWNVYATSLFEKYETEIRKFVKNLICNVAEGKTAAYFGQIADHVMSALSSKMESQLMKQIKQETRPFTLNHYLNDILIKLRNEELLDMIKSTETEQFTKDHVIALLKNFGVGSSSPEEKEALEMHWALTAYKKVASKRFMDRVPQTIELYFIERFLEQVTEQVRGIEDKDLEVLLAETQDIVNLRQRLQSQLQSLKASKDHIQKLLAF